MGGLSCRRFRLNPRPLHCNSRCKLISNALAFRMTRQAKPRRSKARQVKPRSHRVVLVCVVAFGGFAGAVADAVVCPRAHSALSSDWPALNGLSVFCIQDREIHEPQQGLDKNEFNLLILLHKWCKLWPILPLEQAFHHSCGLLLASPWPCNFPRIAPSIRP